MRLSDEGVHLPEALFLGHDHSWCENTTLLAGHPAGLGDPHKHDAVVSSLFYLEKRVS